MNLIMKSSLALCIAVCSVCIPALSFAQVAQASGVSAAPLTEIKVMAWNIWGRYNEDDIYLIDGKTSRARMIEILKQSEVDIICMIESYGSAAAIADALGFYRYITHSGDNLCIFSRYPLTDLGSDAISSPFNHIHATAHLPDGRKVRIHNVWLTSDDSTDASVAELDDSQVTYTDQMFVDSDAGRFSTITDILNSDMLKHDLALSEKIPVIMAGDFNWVSHLDYNDATKALGLNFGRVIPVPTSLKMEATGFVDSYRFCNPLNTVAAYGYTWTPVLGDGWGYVGSKIVPISTPGAQPDKFLGSLNSRIDYVYHKGSYLTPIASVALVNHYNYPTAGFPHFPADHGAVLTTYQLTPNTVPSQAPALFEYTVDSIHRTATVTFLPPTPAVGASPWTISYTRDDTNQAVSLTAEEMVAGSVTVSNLTQVTTSLTFTATSDAVTSTTTVIVKSPFVMTPALTSTSIMKDLYCYLPLDGNTQNVSKQSITPTINRIVHNGDASVAKTPSAQVYVEGISGEAAKFGDWWLDIDTPQAVKTESFTIAMWIKVPLYNQTPWPSNAAFMGTGNWNDMGISRGFLLAMNDEIPTFVWNCGKRDDINTIYKLNEWNYLTYTFDRTSNLVTGYRNGTKIFQAAFCTSDGETSFAPLNTLLFGRSHGSDAWTGESYQDEIALWTRALSEQEASALYTDYKGVLKTALQVSKATEEANALSITVEQLEITDPTTVTYTLAYGASDAKEILSAWENKQTFTFNEAGVAQITTTLPIDLNNPVYYRVFTEDPQGFVSYTDVYLYTGAESININIAGANGITVPTDSTLFGHGKAQVPNALWTTSTVDESTERLDALKAYRDGVSVNTGASVTIRGGGSYGYVPNEGFPAIQRGWVNGAALSFEGIPYAQYTAVVYFNSDWGSNWDGYFSPIRVIDHDKGTTKYYTYKSGILAETTKFQDEWWGVIPHATSTSEEGKNYIVIPGLSASELTLEALHMTPWPVYSLGSVSAIQIIKETSVPLFINRSAIVTPEKQLLARGTYTEQNSQLHYGIAYSTSKEALHTAYTHKTLGVLPGDTYALEYLLDKSISANEPLYYRWFTYTEGAAASTYTYTTVSEAYTPLQEGIVLYLNGESTENLITGDMGVTTQGATPIHTWQSGERGAAYHFNKGNWYLDAAQPACIAFNDFTLALWIKKEASDSTNRAYFGTQNYDVGSNYGFVVREGGVLTGSWNDNVSHYAGGSRIDHTFCKEEFGGPWQHLVIVGNRTGNIISLYTDGIPSGTLPMKATPPTAEESYIADGMSLLFGHSGAVKSYLSNSYQDEIILWDRALTATDVQSLVIAHQGILDTSLTHRIAMADRTAWKLQARYPNQDGLTYGICYGTADGGAILSGWDTTQEIGAIVDSTLTWTSTFANTQNMVYRWFVKEGDTLIFSTPYTLEAQVPGPALENIKSGLVLYLDGKDVVNKVASSPLTVTAENNNPTYKSVKDNRNGASSAYYFNRGNWLIDVGQPDCVNTGDFTLGAWINEQDAVVNGGSLFGTQNWGGAGGGSSLGFSMHHLYDGYTFTSGWGTGVGERTDMKNYEVATNKWQYVTITVKRSTNQLLTYLNGELQGTQKFRTSIADGAPVGATPYINTTAGLNLLFGGSGLNDAYVCHALIDEIALWDRALTAEEVKTFVQTYQGELLGAITPMPHSVNRGRYWQFNAIYEESSVTYGICYGATDGGETLDGWTVSKDLGVVNNDNKLTYQSDIPTSNTTVYRWYVNVGGEVTFSEARTIISIPEAQILNGLELYLDGTSTVNKITQGTPITIIGQPAYRTTQDNRTVASSAYVFNDGTWYINAGKPTCVDTGDFTLSAWVNEQAPVNDGGSFFGTQNWGSGGGSYKLGFSAHHHYSYDGGESFTNSWGGGGTRDRNSFIHYDDKGTDIWQYITVTIKRSTNELITYVDGEHYVTKVLNPSLLAGTDIGSTPYIADGMNLLIGGSGIADSYMCHALLDEIALWNRTLTPEEIKAVYQQYNGEIDTTVITFGGSVQLSNAIKADITTKAKAQFPSLTKITISQESAERAYLLNLTPEFTADATNASHIIATLDCQFLVSELRIDKEGGKDVVIATATITVTTGSLGNGITGTLALSASKTLTGDFKTVTTATPGQTTMTLKADFDANTPFYKMNVVERTP